MKYSANLDFIPSRAPNVQIRRLRVHDPRKNPRKLTHRNDVYLEFPGTLRDRTTGAQRPYSITTLIGSIERYNHHWEPDGQTAAWLARRGRPPRAFWKSRGEARRSIKNTAAQDLNQALRDLQPNIRRTTV